MTTYLLGAGASAECVPVVEYFRSTFRNIVNIGALVNGVKNAGFIDEIENLKLSFATYYSIIRQHPTIDIFAKKLYVKNNKTTRRELRLLKQKLVLYFNFLQYSRPIDDRYTKFFASIIAPKQKFILPKDINIITWNYDFQLELAVSDFLIPKDKNINNIQRLLKIYPCPYHQVEFNDYNKDFTVTKLNGSAFITEGKESKLTTYFNPTKINYIQDVKDLKNQKDWLLDNEVIEILNEYENKANEEIMEDSLIPVYYNDLTFAWEAGDRQSITIERAKKVVAETEELVIIGYSFPYVNRVIDKDLIGSMLSLKNVFIQDPYINEKRFNLIKRRIHEFNNNEPDVEHIDDAQEFYIP